MTTTTTTIRTWNLLSGSHHRTTTTTTTIITITTATTTTTTATTATSTFHLQKLFPKGGLLVLDDLMVEGGEDKELLNLFTKHSHHQNITVLYLCQDMFPPGKYAKSISRNAHYVIALKSPRDQLGMRNLLLQAFPTCWQDMMDMYQKVTERPFGYTVLDLHPASDDRKRVFSHLLTHEGYPRWHRGIRKEDV